MEAQTKLALCIDEAAVAAGVKRTFLYEEMKEGRLPYVKLGSRRVILKADLEAYLNSRRAVAA
jgi:excisionase family DNA binding protein